MIRKVLTTLALTLGLVASCTTPAPASSSPHGRLSIAWSTPKVTPASKRTIEVVDRLGPAKWHVSAAVEWLDRYTASNMKTVSRCSGRAWKCVTIRGGKLSGSTLGLAKGSTITIDTAKVDRRGYRSDTSRKKVMAHELAHTFGLGHTGSRTLMATSLPRVTLSLNAGQRAYLHKR